MDNREGYVYKMISYPIYLYIYLIIFYPIEEM